MHEVCEPFDLWYLLLKLTELGKAVKNVKCVQNSLGNIWLLDLQFFKISGQYSSHISS